MKNLIIILLSLILFSSCYTTNKSKYGCPTTYKPNNPVLLRGHGHVEYIDSNVTLIRVEGIIVKNDTELLQSKYVLAYDAFDKSLKPYIGSYVKFECKTFLKPNTDIVYVHNGCVEKYDDLVSNN